MTKKIIYIIYTLILWGTTLGFAQGAKGNGGDQTTATRLLQAGDKFYDQRLYTASMKSYLDGLRIAEHQGYSELTARFYNGMGNLYSTQGDYQMGLYFYRKALSSSRKTGQKTLQNAVLNNLVGASCFVGQADSGMVFLQQMEANVEHNSGYRYNILMGRGLVAKSQDQPAAAASYYIQARQYAIRAGMDSSFVDNTNSCLAQLYMDTHRLDSAILLLKKNEEWARRTNHDEFLAETMHLLAQAYDAQGDALLADIGRVMGKVEEFCSTDFSIDRLAQLVGSNPRYVSEAINEGYGKNFRSFLNDYRIKEAMQRLADNDRYGHYTIKAISESVGYKSQANFINIFTRLTGMKPSIYQKISRERISIEKSC